MALATVSGLPAAASDRPATAGLGPRAGLVLLTLAAVGGALALGPGSTAIEPDLARVIRCMAAIKGVFAVAAFAACLWRLGRPAPGWRGAVYVAGPPLMAAGSLALWTMQFFGPAALGLHAGLIAVVAAALTDRDFIVLARRASAGASPASARAPRSARA